MSLVRAFAKKKAAEAEAAKKNTDTRTPRTTDVSKTSVNDIISLYTNDAGFGDVDSRAIADAVNAVNANKSVRGAYNNYSPKIKYEIGKHAAIYGNIVL